MIIVFQFVLTRPMKCNNDYASRNYLATVILTFVAYSASFFTELAMIVVGLKGASPCHVCRTTGSQLNLLMRCYQGTHTKAQNERVWIYSLSCRVLRPGTPLEVSKRRLMMPLMNLQLFLWTFQLAVASTFSAPSGSFSSNGC